jgi:hypothetical protein
MRRTSLLLLAALVAGECVLAQTQTPTPTPAPAPKGSGWEAALKEVTEACKGETPQLCPGVTTATALSCLQTNIGKLTPGCRDAVVKAATAALNL